MKEDVSLHIDPLRCGASFCCLVWFIATCVFAGVFGWSYSEWASGEPFRLEEACRLTYSDESVISEKEMRSWAGMEGWPLKHPRFDVSKRACTCSSDADPSSPSGDTPAWIAPGDLVLLYKEGVAGRYIDPEFVSKYSDVMSPKDHVKVCIDETRLTTLWNGNPPACHSIHANGTVKEIFTGWDGNLYCFISVDVDDCTENYTYCCNTFLAVICTETTSPSSCNTHNCSCTGGQIRC